MRLLESLELNNFLYSQRWSLGMYAAVMRRFLDASYDDERGLAGPCIYRT